MSALTVRQLEAAVTYFVVALVGLGALALTSVNVADTHAVFVALGAAVLGAVGATVKHFFPALTALEVKKGE